jgi:hypothetical protein
MHPDWCVGPIEDLLTFTASGWADGAFVGASERGEGVGDDVHSWAYDGWRQLRWNGSSSSWGSRWKRNQTVCCAVDMDARRMWFALDGEWNMGEGHDGKVRYVRPHMLSLTRYVTGI